ncbi:MAG: NADH-quinone oxidoreductase subunit C [Mariprofundaceae bacterium]
MKHLANTWFAEKLGDQGIYTQYREDHHPAHMPCLEIRRLDWQQTAENARRLDMRLVAVWATEGGCHEDEPGLYAYMCFAHPEHRHALIRTFLSDNECTIASISKHYIAACRMERHMQDMFAIEVADIPDTRRWLKHEHWPEDAHPLLRDFAHDEQMQRASGEYAFVKSGSEGVYEIPVGPVHAGIIEPGHFRFLAVGEMILNMEQRLGYAHKGIEKSMEGRTAEDGARLAARVSGDCSVGHAWAFAQACEYAANCEAPKRASYLRGVLCERERIANHIGDIGAICNDASFAFMHVQSLRLREDMARLHARLFGHRLMMNSIVPGGVSIDLDAENCLELIENTRSLAAEVEHLRAI